jgi:hypothetical protein
MQTIRCSTVFDAPVAEVWPTVRDFDDWPAPLSAGSSEIEGGRPSDVVGSVRRLTGWPDGTVPERLLGLADHARTATFSVEKTSSPPMPRYIGTFRLTSVNDGGARSRGGPAASLPHRMRARHRRSDSRRCTKAGSTAYVGAWWGRSPTGRDRRMTTETATGRPHRVATGKESHVVHG